MAPERCRISTSSFARFSRRAAPSASAASASGTAAAALDAGQERELAALLDQTAIALDRALLTRESAKTAALEQSEKLSSALLSSLSHDLRTPLSSIVGAVTSLRQFGGQMSEASRDDLLISIEEEAARLSRFVSNLLDMTRLEGGALNARRDWVDVSDVIREAAERGRKTFPGRAIEVSLAAICRSCAATARCCGRCCSI